MVLILSKVDLSNNLGIAQTSIIEGFQSIMDSQFNLLKQYLE